MRIFLQTNVIFLLLVLWLSGCESLYPSVLVLQTLSQPPTEAVGNDKGRSHLPSMKKEKIIFRGPTQTKKVAITFDDGPDGRYTAEILDILKKYHVPATFFVLGKLSQKHPRILKRIAREGHTLGNHSWNHVDFTKLSTREIQNQLERTNQEILRLTGKKPLFFRPPFGAINQQVITDVNNYGYSIIYWNIDTRDWQGRSADKMIDTVTKHLGSGSIILFHSGGGTHKLDGTVQALPRLISLLRNKGYEMVTVDQLIGRPAYVDK